MLRKNQMAQDKLIYFDNAATTLVDSEILKTYIKTSEEYFANASSIHFEGQKAARLLEKSKAVILSTLKLEKTHKVIFTSGATESNNLAIKGYTLKYSNRGRHIIVSSIEHPSVLEVAKQLEKQFGFEITYLPVKENGKVSIDELKAAIRKDTILVSIMAVNNEIGSINDIESIGELLKQYPKIVFHVDATQAIGKINLNYSNVDMLSFSAHKIHGIKGSGALIIRQNIELLSVNSGGGQEYGIRSGTNDVPAGVCLAKTVQLSMSSLKEKFNNISSKTSLIYEYLRNNPDLYHISSNEENPYIVNFSLINKKASVVVEGLSNKNIMVSSLSACHSKNEKFSYVIMAINHDENLSHNTIRISLDEHNSEEEVKTLIQTLDSIVKEIKQ